MNRFVIIVALSVLAITGWMSLFFTPAAVAETDLYLKVERFTWKEFSDNGMQLLEETGELYGLGFLYKTDRQKGLTFKGKGELFGGSIDYDGQTQAGAPAKTDVDYLGVKLEGSLGWKFMLTEKASIEPFAGLGLGYWSRDLNSTTYAIGYEELWWSFYAGLGVRGDLVVSDVVKLFAEGGIKLPIHNETEVDLTTFGIGTVTLEPGNEASAFAEIGLKWKMLKASVFYQGLRFSKSDAVIQGGYIFWQPESKSDIFGVTVGVAF